METFGAAKLVETANHNFQNYDFGEVVLARRSLVTDFKGMATLAA